MKKNFSAPKKALGQNFLQDQSVITNIVNVLNVTDQDVVIEIGPGRGALTELLLKRCKQLHVIEFDNELVNYWKDRAKTDDKLTVHNSDVLEFDFNQVAVDNQKIKVIGNLPYNISSPILFHLMGFNQQIERQIFMLQKEVVERIVAQPKSKQFGRLSVMLQQQFYTEHLFDVPPDAFYPPPKVNSAIVELIPLIDNPVINKNIFAKLVKMAFSQRRKTIKNTLKEWVSEQQLLDCEVDPKLRPEAITVEKYVDLANALVTKKN